MTESGNSNRRDFLTGRAAQRALRQRGDELADALLEAPIIPPQAGETIRLETRAMACSWNVVLNPGPPRQVMVASDALDLVHLVEDLLTVYRETSRTAEINRTAFQNPQPLPPEMRPLISTCQRLWKETEGAFDPATGTLVRLWREARAAGRVPDDAEVEQALARSGLQHVRIESDTISFTTEGLLLDFGAIGKGYAIDLAVEHLLQEDLENFLVHGGFSSLAARGDHAGHRGWPVGIRNPLFTQRRYATVLLQDRAMSTSGSNVQYFRHRGRRYGHILDPRTGWPTAELLSVTVLAPTAAEADALSTAFYVMGLDKARRYCDDHSEVGAILIPSPGSSRNLQPILCNVPEELLFFEETAEGDVPPDAGSS